ncbi:penicillin-binding protein 1A [Wansuia hejianensis]|uniref:Penicillin-binding protein 1A n=1 Tax=Wansuia hejianensis TaxID=2763667 RepID=A0A926EYJ4_9FIRM|nr:PBP1A family penicillin-binding protein [Wansuia hejianensis]MBC8590738.1 PBP1A family penicillin-binding protein [Wansuia hejianensis]
MSKDNNNKKRNNKKKSKNSFTKYLKIFVLVILILGVLSGGVIAGISLSIIKDAPEIDPTKINASLSQTSSIYDNDGKLIEKIETAEYRTFVSLDKIPKDLQNAFIAIEDERFYDHPGIDPKGIVGSAMENLKSDGIVRGASTITQQLVKNVYLNSDKKWSRKIKEAYLALQVERVLEKDQILESYLNRNFFGQNAYGVQEAAQTYFSKDVEDLTLAESALFAGVVKSTQQFQPYIRVKPENFDSNKDYQVGEADVLGEKYILVFNEKSVERQKIVLAKMLDLGMISKEEYDSALKEDIKANLKPGQKKITDITSYFTDYVKTQVIDALVSQLGYSKEQAKEELFAGGLQIYSTIDVNLQQELEDVYENFTNILVGNTNGARAPILIDWRLNRDGNIIDESGRTIYYRKNNLLNDDSDLVIEKGTYEIKDNGDLSIKNNKLTIYPKHIDIADYYRIDDKKNLVTHTVGSIVIPEGEFTTSNNKELIITKGFLDKTENFYNIDQNKNLIINGKYFYQDKEGIVQPQSATVISDYRTGHIKAIVGGRDIDGNRILNRATDSQRQPGSTIKPISVYLPALDNGYTAATAIDDIPYTKGNWTPRNWYRGYRGIHTLRQSVEQSVNVNSVKTVEDLGSKTIMNYLEKMGIINKANPAKDNFITSEENSKENDENLSSLALGGMTKGLTPLEVTAAFGAIANDGVYIEPISFTKVLDRDGNILIDNIPKETVVTSPQIAYIMKDILRTTVTNGLAGSARLSNMVVAGKTGTTQNAADIWFVGFTPYYVSGVWIGNDSPKITINQTSGTAARLWQNIMTRAHTDLARKASFDRPEGIVSANICTQSGLLATPTCSLDPRHVIKTEIFAKGTVPRKHCDIHVEAEVCKITGKLANKYCPTEDVIKQAFIQRIPPYIPSEHNNIVPADFKFTLPTQVCDKHNILSIILPDPDKDDDDKNIDDPNENNNNEDNNENNSGNENNDNEGNNNDNDNNNDSNNRGNRRNN